MKHEHKETVESAVEILRCAFESRFAPDDPHKLPNVIFLAWHGMEEAHQALCNYAFWLTDQGKPLPDGLQLYVNWRASEGFKLNRKRFGNAERDLAICMAVRQMNTAGFNIDRNETTQQPSACSLVAEALCRLDMPMTEDAVRQIIKRKGKELLEVPWRL